MTALHYAAAMSREDIVRMLISRKADASIFGGVSVFIVK